jgi:hypothetical protein
MNRGDNCNSVFSMCGKRAEETKLLVTEIVTEKEIARKPKQLSVHQCIHHSRLKVGVCFPII